MIYFKRYSLLVVISILYFVISGCEDGLSPRAHRQLHKEKMACIEARGNWDGENCTFPAEDSEF